MTARRALVWPELVRYAAIAILALIGLSTGYVDSAMVPSMPARVEERLNPPPLSKGWAIFWLLSAGSLPVSALLAWRYGGLTWVLLMGTAMAFLIAEICVVSWPYSKSGPPSAGEPSA